jgi:hypothetical protein
VNRLLLTSLAALLLPAQALAAARFAVVVGSNVGAAGRPRLWFAEQDAERFRATLLELGDFSEDRAVLVRGGSAARVREALAGVEARIALARKAGDRPLLVFYYSGHAGPGGLELGSDRLGFEELRGLVTGSAADAKVAIIDACEAGLLTQVKGASAAPALDFALPAEDRVQGTAFITSTAVGEAAQESAALGGSFFTHHLDIALRGAGDTDGDGLVTLAEAFRYTAARTLAGTAATLPGPQHATYEFKMSGRGDVVLADLRRADSRLALPPDPGAGYFLRGPMNILAEVPGENSAVTLALPAGRYAVERRGADGRATTSVVLTRGETLQLPPLVPTRYEQARSKGGPKPGLLFGGAGAATLGLPGFGVAPMGRIGVRKEVGPFGIRIGFDYLRKSVVDAGLRYDLDYTGGAVSALYPLFGSRVLLEAGPELGFGYARQRLADKRSFNSGIGRAGLAAMVTAPLGPVRIGLDGGLSAQLLKLDGKREVRPAASLSALAIWGF